MHRSACHILLVLLACVGVSRASEIFIDPMFSVSVTYDVLYGSSTIGVGTPEGPHLKDLYLDVYTPVGPDLPDKLPAILLAHKGGFFFGDKSWISTIATDLASRGYVAISIDHRLYPEGLPEEFDLLESSFDPVGLYDGLGFEYERGLAFTAAINDSKQAIDWIHDNADNYNIDIDRLVAGGESSGARLALALGFAEAEGEFAAVLSLLGAIDHNEFLIDEADIPVVLFMFNTLFDDLVSIEAAQTLVEQAESVGVPVQYHLAPSGHDLSYLMLDDGDGTSPWQEGVMFLADQLNLDELTDGPSVPEVSTFWMLGIVAAGLTVGRKIRRRQGRD